MNYQFTKKKREGAGRSIGVVVPELTNLFFANLLSGADEAASAAGCQLTFAFTNNDSNKELRAIQHLSGQGVSALILTTATATSLSAHSGLLKTLDIPVVLVDRICPSLPYTCLTYNHRKGAFFAVKHLLDLGHRRVACLSGDTGLSVSAFQRVKGYYLAFREYGLPAPEASVYPGNYLEDSGYRLADAIFERGYTALFSCNDLMAYGFYKRARELGRLIPRDISVVGYDDLFFSDLMDPPMTTVSQDARALGFEAVQRALMEAANPGAAHQDIYYEPSLVVRKSTIQAK